MAGQVATGLSFLVLARRLGADQFGLFAILSAAGVVLAGLVDFGSSQLQTRQLAKGLGLDSFSSWLWRRTAWQVPVIVAAIAAAQILVGGDTGLLVVVALMSQGLTLSFSTAWSGAVRALRSPAIAVSMISVGNVMVLIVVVAAPERLLIGAAAISVAAAARRADIL